MSLHSNLSYLASSTLTDGGPPTAARVGRGAAPRGSSQQGLLGRPVPAVGRVSPAEDVGGLKGSGAGKGWKGGKSSIIGSFRNFL